MGKQTQTIELKPNISYTFYTVLTTGGLIKRMSE